MPSLPFTHEQFLAVFATYNENIWPAQVAGYLLAALVLVAILRNWRFKSVLALSTLALMWIWTGLAYHWLHFASINQAAPVFGALFVVQGLLLGAEAVRDRMQFTASNGAAGWLGWALITYALLLYPLIGLLLGQRYPEMPVFGVTPCPVTLFTFGLLLLSRHTRWWLLLVPAAWALVGGSAAALLHVPQDWVLLASVLSVLVILWPRQHEPRLDPASGVVVQRETPPVHLRDAPGNREA